MDRVVRSAVCLAYSVLESNISHRRSVAALCMLFKIKSNTMHPLSGALPVPYMPIITCRQLFFSTLQWLFLRCTVQWNSHQQKFLFFLFLTSQYRRNFVTFLVSLWNDLIVTLCLMVWDWLVLRAEPMLSYWPNLFFFASYCFIFFSLTWVGCVGLSSSDW